MYYYGINSKLNSLYIRYILLSLKGQINDNAIMKVCKEWSVKQYRIYLEGEEYFCCINKDIFRKDTN